MSLRTTCGLLFVTLLGLGSGCTLPTGLKDPVSLTTTNYCGWPGSYVLRNAYAEVVVVPSIGRVMRFAYRGEESVFWENPMLLGKPTPALPWATPGSFGGDKTWPAPQSHWDWPPPPAFDSLPCVAHIEGQSIVLTTPIDPRFGIRAIRRVVLDPFEPVLRITTTYEKLEGPPVDLSVWVISQFRDPVGVYFRIPKDTRFPLGYNNQWGIPTNQVSTTGSLLRMVRSRTSSHKIGSDATTLLWVGRDHMCLVETDRPQGYPYPDNHSSVEVYTNPDPAAYVELETLGPLQSMKAGDRISASNRYTLKRRRREDPNADAQPLL